MRFRGGKKMETEYRYCKIADTTLAYTEKGEGEVLILLHGNGENGGYFSYQTDYFSRFFRVIALDSRGHGKSERGEKPLTLQCLADDLYEFMQTLQIEKANILGFSDGGNIALLFALKYPQKVIKLVANGANLNTKGVKPFVQAGVVLGNFLLSFSKDEKARRKREILSLMLKQPNITKEQLQTLDMPVLVIAGTNDMIRHKHTQYIAQCIKNSRLVFLDGDHFIARGNAQIFNKAVFEFLTEKDGENI